MVLDRRAVAGLDAAEESSQFLFAIGRRQSGLSGQLSEKVEAQERQSVEVANFTAEVPNIKANLCGVFKDTILPFECGKDSAEIFL